MVRLMETNFGKIPVHWEISTIEKETEFVTDYVANGSFASLAENVNYKTEPDYAVLIRLTDYNNNFKGNFVYVDKHAYDFLGKSRLLGGEIIISNVGAYAGTVFFAPKLNIPMTLGPNSIMLNFKNGNDFFYYWLKSPFGKYSLDSLITGSAQPKFNKTSFRKMSIPVPPLDEQKKIANILSSLDDKIELNNKINDNLEKQTQAIFKSWFADFEPFQNGEFADSELGMIPKGWKVGKFTEIIYVLGGGTPNTQNELYWNGTIPFFTPKDATDSFFTLSTEKYITNEGLNKCNSKLYPKFTVFVTARGTVGKVAIAGKNMAMNQSCYALIGKGSYEQFFVYCFTIKAINNLINKANGAVFSALVTRDFDSEYVVIPPSDIANEFNKTVSPIFNMMLMNTDQNRILMETRDSLLPRLMNGDIKVK